MTNDCIFCQKLAPSIETFAHCYAIWDQFPVSPGHLLIIPHEHTPDWFTASDVIRQDMLQALLSLKTQLDKSHKPSGYNIGANCGTSAGQTIFHLHLHLIPRYDGDTPYPRGGVRGVIPTKQSY